MSLSLLRLLCYCIYCGVLLAAHNSAPERLSSRYRYWPFETYNNNGDRHIFLNHKLYRIYVPSVARKCPFVHQRKKTCVYGDVSEAPTLITNPSRFYPHRPSWSGTRE